VGHDIFDETRGNWPPGEWLVDEGWTQPTMVDPDGSAAETWGLTSFPYFVAIDANGDVVARASGELTTAQFEELLLGATHGLGRPRRARGAPATGQRRSNQCRLAIVEMPGWSTDRTELLIGGAGLG
jgi:hypothetical protein